jgi:L-alanine-DL-glutamate epimerase-like enolase superfamily enzyme
MKVKSVDVFKLNIELTQTIRVPIGEISAAQNVAIRINTDSGIVGWGEASAFPPITGDSQESNYSAAQAIAQLIRGKDPLAIEARMREINGFTVGEPSIRSAFDMALYDILAKHADMPLYKLLGGEKRELRTDQTIGMQHTVEETIVLAKAILAQGFDAIKLKVGRQGLADVPHVRAVRELVGPEFHLKIDSNQGWDFSTAVANIRAMESLNLQYSEQPLAARDFDNMARLRSAVNTPICADESVFDHRDALKLVKMEAVDYLNIKLGKAGGVNTALKINAIAEAANCKCMIGCFAESRLGLSVAAHLATAKPNIHFIDLDSAFNFKEDPVIGGMTYDENQGGVIYLPDTPGHGASFDESYFEQGSSVTV